MSPKTRGLVDGLIQSVGLLILTFGPVYAIKDGSTAAYISVGVGAVIFAFSIGRMVMFVWAAYAKDTGR